MGFNSAFKGLNLSVSCMYLYQRTSFLIPNKCTFLIRKILNELLQPISVHVYQPQGERNASFLHKQILLRSCYLLVPCSVPASSLTLITCKKYNCTYIKTYGCAIVKILLIVKCDLYTVEIINVVFVRGHF